MKTSVISLYRHFHSLLLILLLCAVLFATAGCGGPAGSAGGDGSDAAGQASADPSGAPGGDSAGQDAAPADGAEGPGTGTEKEPFPFVDAGQAPDSATVMVYLTGSDLEAGSEAATQDLQEMLQSGIDLSRTHLLVYTGGSPVWHSEDPVIPNDANIIYRLTEEGFREVQRYDPLSMGEPESLTRFLNYACEEVPAENYYLILWDHGNGPVMGYGSDRQYNGDALTLPEMKTAMDASPFGKDRRLAMVGFDACLMSSAELMCVWSDYADLLVASQELEPSMGWRYSFLKDVCRVSPRALAREIVDVYMKGCSEFFEEHPLFQSDLTLAVLDLTRADALESSLNDLFAVAAEDVSGDFNKLATARVRSHGFARAGSGSEYDLVDLESLLTGMEEKYPDETAAARQALQEAVVYRDSNISESCGLSLFYPYYNKKYYQNLWKEEYGELGCLSEYAAFLQRYDQVWLGTDLKDLFEGELRPKENGAATYSMELTEQQLAQYAQGRYYILRRTGEGLYSIVYVSNAVEEKNGTLSAVFDGRIIYVGDDYGDKNIPIVRAWETVGDMTDYTILGAGVQRDKEDGGDSLLNYENMPVDIQLAVNAADGSVTVKGIYEREEGEDIVAGKRKPVLPEDWKLFTFYNLKSRYLVRGDDGHVLPFWDWPEGDWITWTEYNVVNGLNFTYEPIYDDGYEYYIMFEVADVQGNQFSSELLPITLDPAPEEEAAVPSEEISWESGRSVVLAEEQGVRISLTMDQKHSSGQTILGLEVRNDNDYPVLITNEDPVLDEEYVSGNSGLWLTAEPGRTAYRDFGGLSELLARRGTACPKQLDINLTVSNYKTGGYMIYKRPYTVRFAGDLQPAALAMPVDGAAAGPQELVPDKASAETDPALPLKVELLGMGADDPSAYTPVLTLDLRVTNTSGSPADFRLGGLKLNGLYYSMDSACTLQPEDVLYTVASIPSSSYKATDKEFSTDDRARRITSLSSVSVLIAQDGHYNWYPLVLSDKGDQDTLLPAGTLLCEEGGIRITAEKPSAWEDDQSPVWPLWIENTTGTSLRITLCREGAEDDWLNYYFTTTAGPDSVTLKILSDHERKMQEPADIRYCAVITDENGQTLLTTQPFSLPEP